MSPQSQPQPTRVEFLHPRSTVLKPRPTPYQVGMSLARLGSLKGLPYGPGYRQADALDGYEFQLRQDADPYLGLYHEAEIKTRWAAI
jgi:hypothetical protein